jgi:hypothetical protein
VSSGKLPLKHLSKVLILLIPCCCRRFDLAVHNSPALLFILLLLSAMALGSAALMLATLLRK